MKSSSPSKSVRLLTLLGGLLAAIPAATRADTSYDSAALRIRLGFPQPQQLAAFYEGRGFDKAMIELIRQQCFINIGIKNKSSDFIWLDLTQWQFSTSEGPLQRRDRAYWKTTWDRMRIPLAHQSTFRWTLLPELLDFHPQEGEGGNIVLPRQPEPFSLIARFPTGADKHGTPIEVRFSDLRCGIDP